MGVLLTHTTLEGRVLDLCDLTPEERAFYRRCKALFGDEQTAWDKIGNLVTGSENPLVRATGGRVTDAVWSQALFQAVTDLEERVAIRTGDMEPDPEDELGADPFTDDWLPVTEGAALKGVHRTGLHAAIRRGDVVAHKDPEGDRLLVSRRSLDHWRPSPARQKAGRKPRPAA